jgi:hypothetical protein
MSRASENAPHSNGHPLINWVEFNGKCLLCQMRPTFKIKLSIFLLEISFITVCSLEVCWVPSEQQQWFLFEWMLIRLHVFRCWSQVTYGAPLHPTICASCLCQRLLDYLTKHPTSASSIRNLLGLSCEWNTTDLHTLVTYPVNCPTYLTFR